MNFTISPIQASERDEWEKLYHLYARFYQVPMNSQILDNAWRWINDPEMGFYALLAKDSQGKGLGMMHFRSMPSPLRGSYVGFLDDLFVRPEYRGKGVVDELFKHLQAFAKAESWPLVRWITAEDNYRARAAYDAISEKTHWITYQIAIDESA